MVIIWPGAVTVGYRHPVIESEEMFPRKINWENVAVIFVIIIYFALSSIETILLSQFLNQWHHQIELIKFSK